MKAIKIIIPVLLMVALVIAWGIFVVRTVGDQMGYYQCLKDAQSSIDDGLYEQAIEFYKASLEYKDTIKAYHSIKDTYDTLYAEEHTPFIRGLYIDDMAIASSQFPKEQSFWVAQIELYMESFNYSSAFNTARRALNMGAKGKALDALYFELLYMVDVDFRLYYDFKTALNGYTTVYDGNKWTVLDDEGTEIVSKYNFIGLINDDGKGLYVNDIDARLLDSKEIARARFDFEVEDAGYYNEACNLLPVKINGKWKYVSSTGEFLPGEFEMAGSFYDNYAVAYTGEKWVQLDTQGHQTALNYTDIKLDQYGCHVQNNCIIAQENGNYYLFDSKFSKIGNVAAKDIDICPDGTLIAFSDGKHWGFMDLTGKVVIEPVYADAKSFSNGYAAVCNDEGLWGFIDEDNVLIIDYTYLDAFYFTKGESCLVSCEEGSVQLLHFMFN